MHKKIADSLLSIVFFAVLFICRENITDFISLITGIIGAGIIAWLVSIIYSLMSGDAFRSD